jgi:hypothetical protein
MDGGTPQKRGAGKRVARAWEEFFSGQGGKKASRLLSQGASKIAEVRARHETDIMRRANVVGIAEGIRTRKGKPTGEPCLVVYVVRKVPRARLSPNDVIPRQIEGIPTDVVEVGRIEPMRA